MRTSEVGVTASLCALLGALINEHMVPDTNTNNGGSGANGSTAAATLSNSVGLNSGSGAGTSSTFNGAIDEDDLEKLFLYSVTWSIGGLLSEDDRPKLDAYLRALASQEGTSSDEAMPKLQADEEDTIFECVLFHNCLEADAHVAPPSPTHTRTSIFRRACGARCSCGQAQSINY